MNPLRKLSVLAVIVALCVGFTASASAQGKPAEAKSKPAAEIKSKEAPWTRKIQEVQFESQPLSEVASYLSDVFPEIYFVVHPKVALTSVSLKLRSVTLDDIFVALEICTKDSAIPATGLVIDPNTGLPMPAGPGPSLQIKKVGERMVSFTAGEASGTAAAEKPVCRAFSLNRYLAGKSDQEADKALSEIQEALHICWKMMEADAAGSSSRSPQLSMHRGTKLLLVVGQAAQVEVVAQVISQLNGEPVMTGYPGMPGAGSANPFADYYAPRRAPKAADPSSFSPGNPNPGGPGGVPGTSPSQNTPPPGN
jgi:hypothetical protein